MSGQPVWVWPDDKEQPVLAGTLEITAGGAGLFTYSDDYVHAYPAALDPVQLKHLSARHSIRIASGDRHGIPGIIADAGPDSWGLKILAQDLGYEPSPLDALVKSPDDGVGNLAVGPLDQKPPLGKLSIDALVDAIDRRLTGDGTAVPPEVDRMLSPDTALGGAKPKASVLIDGELWIAKLPEKGDPPHLPYFEAAALCMANRLSIESAKAKVQPLAQERSILLVRRFDRCGARRYASASALTVLGPGGQVTGDGRSYLALARRLKPWVREALPGVLDQLWVRIVFNALIGNGDDHPRNHALLKSGGQWQLSPAFDLVPTYIRRERLSLSMPFLEKDRQLTSFVSAANLVQAAPAFGVPIEAARERLIAMASRIVDEWSAVMTEIDAPENAVRQSSVVTEWGSRLLDEAKTIDPAALQRVLKPRRSAGWTWSPH